MDFIKNSQNLTHQTTVPNSSISTQASIDIATISNYRLPLDKVLSIDLSVELNHSSISFHDFMNCFYHQPGSSFAVNNLNTSFTPILLSGQTYSTIDNKQNTFTLYNQIIKAYCEKHSLPENTISAFKKIELAKETFRYQSLASNYGTQTSLSWSMVIEHLKNTNQIKYTKDPEDNADIKMRIHYIFYSSVMDVSVECIFTFCSSIPFYKNVSYNEIHFMNSPYSQDEPIQVSSNIPIITSNRSLSIMDPNTIKQNTNKPNTIKLNTIKQNTSKHSNNIEVQNEGNNENETVKEYDEQTVLTKRILDQLLNDDDGDIDDDELSLHSRIW